MRKEEAVARRTTGASRWVRRAGLACLLCATAAAGIAESHGAAPAPKETSPQTGPQIGLVSRPWTGDFDGMVERRRLRILTPYSKTLYFIDRGVPRGIVQDLAVQLEKTLNVRLKTSDATKLHVVVIPTSRDELYPALVQGRGDIIVAGITVTPEREKQVDFTFPAKANVKEIVVTGPGAPALAALEDLGGQEVAVRAGSIQLESLQKLNETFKQRGKPPVRIRSVPSALEDEDILEMTNAGLLKIVIVDDYYVDFWKQILPGITPHPAIAVREGGALAWAVRPNSPKLIAELDPIVKANAAGTLFGNELLRRYLKDTRAVRSATSAQEIRKFQALVGIFRKYADKYSVDYLLMVAQGFQESRLDQTVKSRVGAVGVMQLMPATGKEMNVGDITQIDPNIEAGVKYIRVIVDRYFKDEPMDDLNKGLFAFASYNAGAGRIRQLRRETAARGLDPNIWFNNVERIVAEKIGRETVTYVSNIYKYYVAYSLVVQEMDEKAKAKAQGSGR